MTVSLDDRMGYFLLGCLIGVGIGYMIRYLQKIDRNVMILKKHLSKDRKESGFMRHPIVADVMISFLVLFTAYAAISTGITNHRVTENSNDTKAVGQKVERITRCNSEFLGKVIVALNERTTYTTAQADANVSLQKAQLKLLAIGLTIPPPSPADGDKAIREYYAKLNKFVDLAEKTAKKTISNPYPTISEFRICVLKFKETK